MPTIRNRYQLDPEYRDRTLNNSLRYYALNKEYLNEKRMSDYTCEACGTVMNLNSKYQHEKGGNCERKIQRKADKIAKKEAKEAERQAKIEAGLIKPRRRRPN